MTTFERLVLLGVLCASVHWTVARASITRFFWSRVRGVFAKLLECPACSGFWLGVLFGALGIALPLFENFWTNVLGNGLVCLFLTPVFEALLVKSLEITAIKNSPEQPVGELPQVPETD